MFSITTTLSFVSETEASRPSTLLFVAYEDNAEFRAETYASTCDTLSFVAKLDAEAIRASTFSLIPDMDVVKAFTLLVVAAMLSSRFWTAKLIFVTEVSRVYTEDDMF